MSTYYHVECRDCNESTDTLGNNVDDQIRFVAKHWDILGPVDALSEGADHIEVTHWVLGSGGTSELFKILRNHSAHALELVSEYGDREKLVVGGESHALCLDCLQGDHWSHGRGEGCYREITCSCPARGR